MNTVHASSKPIWERRYTMTTVHVCSKLIQDLMLCIMTGSGSETKNGIRPNCKTQMQMLLLWRYARPQRKIATRNVRECHCNVRHFLVRFTRGLKNRCPLFLALNAETSFLRLYPVGCWILVFIGTQLQHAASGALKGTVQQDGSGPS